MYSCVLFPPLRVEDCSIALDVKGNVTLFIRIDTSSIGQVGPGQPQLVSVMYSVQVGKLLVVVDEARVVPALLEQ